MIRLFYIEQNRDSKMKQVQTMIISLCIFLISAATLASSNGVPSIKSILKTYNNNLLTPADIEKGLPALTQAQFPLNWQEIHLGMIKQELTYTYHYKSTKDSETFIDITTSLDPTPVEAMLKNGIEHQKMGNSYASIAHKSCLLTLGKCQ